MGDNKNQRLTHRALNMKSLSLILTVVIFASSMGATRAEERVGLIGNDDRLTYREYAQRNGLPLSEVNKLFSTTGLLRCDGQLCGTAQLTGSNSVITSAGHIFAEGHCEGKSLRKKSYEFVIKNKGQTQVFTIVRSSIKLSECTPNPSTRQADWAVARLSKPVPDVKPYEIPNIHGAPKIGQKLINPSAMAQNRSAQTVPTIALCEVKNHTLDYFQNDCDVGRGASGSANLVEDFGKLIVIGVQSHASYDGANYDRRKVFIGVSEVNYPFLKAMKNAVRENP